MTRYVFPRVGVPMLVVAMLVAGGARAQAADASPAGESDSERAERDFRDGVAAYAAGRYHTAIDLFVEADALRPSPELAFDIAKAHEQVGNDSFALRYYGEYLRRAGHPDDEGDVRRRMDRLRARTSPEEARPAARAVPDPPSLAGPSTASPASSDRPSEPGRDTVAGADSPGTGSPLTTVGVIGLGAGAAALAGAVVFEILRANAERNAEREREQIHFADDVSRMESDRTAARVLGGAGAALVVTGALCLVLGASGSRPTNTPSVALELSPTRVAAGAGWRF